MIIKILLSIASLVFLMAIHELGHFLIAKRFGVRVDEFGIGLPPRLFAKRFGETVYSLNLLPIGAFVNIYGEEDFVKDERSFSEKPIWQRALILMGGVLAFWAVAFVSLVFVAKIGMPVVVPEDFSAPDVTVMALGVQSGSPAAAAGIIAGDLLVSLESGEDFLLVETVPEIREFLTERKGEELLAKIKRGDREESIYLTPDSESGLIGVIFDRVRIEKLSWGRSVIEGARMTVDITTSTVYFLGKTVKSLIIREAPPVEVKVAGPAGVVKDFLAVAIGKGLSDYLQTIAIISISLAIFNLLPIPALDGGKLLFLLIEKIKGKPIDKKIEQNLSTASFVVLIIIFCLVTFYDIKG